MFLKVRWVVVVTISFTLVLCLSAVNFAQAQQTFPEATYSALQLNQMGLALLDSGAAAEALELWQESTELYRAEGDVEGVRGSQFNQALAMQVLGQYSRACFRLVDTLELSSNLCQSLADEDAITLESSLSAVDANELNRIGLRLLGETLRLLGSVSSAETILTFARQGQWLQNPAEDAKIALALGSVHQLSAQEAIQMLSRIGLRDVQIQTEVIAKASSEITQAIEQYHLAASITPDMAVKTRLNLVDLYADVVSKLDSIPQWQSSALKAVVSQLNRSAEEAYVQLQDADFDQLSAIESIYGRLNLGENLLTLWRAESGRHVAIATDLSVVQQLADESMALAEEMNDSRALSFALGLKADVEKSASASASEVIALYERALTLAQTVQANDAAFEFAYELAKAKESTGEMDAARQKYKSAIASLDQVRDDLIAVNSELRFNFREKIEPVYRDYIRFIVSGSDPNLPEAIAVYESFQRAEVENFLRCGRLLSTQRTEDSRATTLYFISLGDVIEVIASASGDYYAYGVPAREVLRAAENLTVNLQSPSFLVTPEEEFLPYAQQLYGALLAPAKEAGILSKSQRLNFVVDVPFQSIPMGLLHDGKQYLTETHTISNSLRLQRSEPDLGRKSLALFSGLIEIGPSADDPRVPDSFDTLPETEFEAVAVQDTLRSKVLLDSAFTADNFADEVATGNYQTIHVSTHGQFSSVPEETFLVAWDELIDIQDMARTFQGAGGNIDLLVLSACQTAAGDERSTLGLAGLAVQSGARSAIASLWLVDSTGSSVLMDRFYQALHQGLPNAEALHQAQLTLMHSTTFSHPFYWAPFVLIGG